MTVRDWRALPAAVVAPLYETETTTWLDRLSWETTGTWHALEQGRLAGEVCGLVAGEPGADVRGWCYGGRRADVMHVGGLVAAAAEVTAALVAGLRLTPEAAGAREWRWFGWFRAPGLSEALASSGATVTPYRYLARDLPPCGSVSAPAVVTDARVRDWRAADASRLPGLLASAYPGASLTRPFASDGTLKSWYEYAGQLLGAGGCGVFDPAMSVVATAADGAVCGIAVVTRLSAAAAHLLQLAIAPGWQGRGLGRALLAAVQARAGDAGCRQLTLLVAGGNHAAARLYAGAGFSDRAAFTAAVQAPPA
jgi:ribosomal protein S18 acetylase RimI-like enzyme